MSEIKTGRIKFLSLAICAVALFLIGRLYYLQVIHHQTYLDQADKQYVRQGESLFDRGSIFFTTKTGEKVGAATLNTGYTIALAPKQIEHPEDVFNVLSGIMPFDEQVLMHKINASNSYVEIAHRVPEATSKRVEALKIKGVNEYKERWRYYPGIKSGANVLGFVGFNDDGVTESGRYGLERYYNDILSRNSSDVYVNFFAEIFSNISDSFLKNEKSEGNIVTTIEPQVQLELERRLASVVKSWKSDLTGGIVMDPSTGEIYAMAMNPTFDPNDFGSEKTTSVFGNPMVDRVYEMGSIIKPLAMAAGLDDGVITPTTKYDDKGSMIINGSKISNFDGKARGVIDMQQVLSQSLNIGMAFVSQKLGNEKLTAYFNSMGFGDETGIDLPGEVHGLTSNLKSPRDIEHVTASFGQGIALTPIATVRALSSLGNGGVLPNPHIVKKIEYTSGLSKTIAYDNTKRVLKPETSDTITRMLVEVVDEALLGGTVKQEHYSVAAKTGTAQIPAPTGGYYQDRYLHSFFGYFPAYKPKFIVFLFTVYPKGAEYASHTLTQPFIDLTKFLINYYDVPPDR